VKGRSRFSENSGIEVGRKRGFSLSLERGKGDSPPERCRKSTNAAFKSQKERERLRVGGTVFNKKEKKGYRILEAGGETNGRHMRRKGKNGLSQKKTPSGGKENQHPEHREA